jgi:predicted NBD/HSP70 family sugar kinase
LFRYIRQALNKKKCISLLTSATQDNLDRLTVPLVAEAARAGDAVAQEALNRVGCYLGIGIASLVNALNPELVVFGGILSLASDFLLPVIHTQLEQHALRWNENAVKVTLSQHQLNSCIMGGLATIYQSVLAKPTKIS